MIDRFVTRRWPLVASLLVALFLGADGPDAAAKRQAEKAALLELQEFVGGWRGAGQVKRGSTEGAWVEKGDWAWKFTADSAALEWKSGDGKYVRAATLRPGDKRGEFLLEARGEDPETTWRYSGTRQPDGQLVLQAAQVPAGQPERITLRTVARGDRLVALFERKSSIGDGFSRLGEVGYTRQGSQFGKGVSFPECVVTGGYGSMTVTFEGKSYPVCCTGCRDIFQMDPAGTLAEYHARKKAERK